MTIIDRHVIDNTEVGAVRYCQFSFAPVRVLLDGVGSWEVAVGQHEHRERFRDLGHLAADERPVRTADGIAPKQSPTLKDEAGERNPVSGPLRGGSNLATHFTARSPLRHISSHRHANNGIPESRA